MRTPGTDPRTGPEAAPGARRLGSKDPRRAPRRMSRGPSGLPRPLAGPPTEVETRESPEGPERSERSGQVGSGVGPPPDGKGLARLSARGRVLPRRGKGLARLSARGRPKGSPAPGARSLSPPGGRGREFRSGRRQGLGEALELLSSIRGPLKEEPLEGSPSSGGLEGPGAPADGRASDRPTEGRGREFRSGRRQGLVEALELLSSIRGPSKEEPLEGSPRDRGRASALGVDRPRGSSWWGPTFGRTPPGEVLERGLGAGTLRKRSSREASA